MLPDGPVAGLTCVGVELELRALGPVPLVEERDAIELGREALPPEDVLLHGLRDGWPDASVAPPPLPRLRLLPTQLLDVVDDPPKESATRAHDAGGKVEDACEGLELLDARAVVDQHGTGADQRSILVRESWIAEQ